MTASSAHGPNGRRRPPPDAVRAWTEREPAARTYRAIQATVSPLLRGVFRIERHGVRRIPKKGPVILVTNHASNLDPVLVIASVRRPLYHLGKHTLFTTRLRSWFFQTLGGQIPVNRERGGNEPAIQAAVAALERGVALGIYPEAHRSPDGTLRRGKSGVGRIAYLSGAPCIPVAVEGTWRVWPKGRRFPKLFSRTRVLVGAPRTWPRDPAKAADRDACQEVADTLMADLASLLGQPYDAKRAPPPRP